jgi:sec-independent protein translocase protein TatA
MTRPAKSRNAKYSIGFQRFDTAGTLLYDAPERRFVVGPIGVPEMIVIGVLALLIFGPRKLPELGRSLGKALTEFRRASSDIRATLEEEVREMERQTKGVAQQVEEAVGRTDDAPSAASGEPATLPESPVEENLPHGDTKPA